MTGDLCSECETGSKNEEGEFEFCINFECTNLNDECKDNCLGSNDIFFQLDVEDSYNCVYNTDYFNSENDELTCE